jgi:hypothetical protein
MTSLPQHNSPTGIWGKGVRSVLRKYEAWLTVITVLVVRSYLWEGPVSLENLVGWGRIETHGSLTIGAVYGPCSTTVELLVSFISSLCLFW